jgi:uncharacterized membrane protein
MVVGNCTIMGRFRINNCNNIIANLFKIIKKMKEILKKVFDKKISAPIFIGFGTFAIFNFIVFPGLSASNTILNVLSAVLGLFTFVFIFYYLKLDKTYETYTHVEPGETELDYVSEDELKPKKRTARKKPKAPEFPMKPHHAKPKTKK